MYLKKITIAHSQYKVPKLLTIANSQYRNTKTIAHSQYKSTILLITVSVKVPKLLTVTHSQFKVPKRLTIAHSQYESNKTSYYCSLSILKYKNLEFFPTGNPLFSLYDFQLLFYFDPKSII